MNFRSKALLTLQGQRQGFVLILMAASVVVMCGFLGLAVDVGTMQYTKRMAQTAADAAAFAGAHEVSAGHTETAETAARQDAALNGFGNGVNGVTVAVNRPPSTGFYTSDTRAVEVIVAKNSPLYFLRAYGIQSSMVRARSVARLGNRPTCVYVLDPSMSNAMVVSGSASINAGCGIQINSTDSKALVASGSACVTGTSIDIVGNYNISSSCPPSPLPTTGAPAVADPLSGLAAPSVGACNQTDYELKAGTSYLSPGVYCGGIKVSGSATTAVLNPGEYILAGGGLTVSGGASIQGDGVFFYNTMTASDSYKPIVISGGSTTSLVAPTSGTYAGILFFQDRSVVSSSQNTVSGGSGGIFEGALYFSTTPLVFSGGSTGTAAYTLIVVDKLTISGASTIGNDYSSLPGGSPIKANAVLAE